MYQYQATVSRVIDGDTLELNIDLGFNITFTQPVRLNGINAPEHNTMEGQAAISFVNGWLATHGPTLIVNTVKGRKEKYGRYLAGIVSAKDGANLNLDLIDGGYAVVYTGGKRT